MTTPRLSIVVRALATALVATALPGCFELGLNTEESKPGNQVGGNSVDSDLSLSADGRYLVTRTKDSRGDRRVWSVDLDQLSGISLPLGDGTTRMLFGKGSTAYFLAYESQDANNLPRSVVHSVSLATGRIERSWTLDGAATLLSIDEKRGRVVAWSTLPWTISKNGEGRWAMQILDVASPEGETQHLDFDHRIVDARFVPSTGDLAVVGDVAPMESQVTLYEPVAKKRHEIDVPNCASSLQLSPQGRTAMLAPTNCSKDPVSIIDLIARTFRKNIPGFGPVAWSPDGEYAVAFGRKDDLKAVANIDTTAAISLLFIEAATLEIEVLELGDDIPIYSITPDGQVVLIYSIFTSSSYDGIVMVDVATRTLRETSGPEVGLSEFVMSPDGQLVYLIDGGLFRLDVQTGKIAYVNLPCGGAGEPTRCNPDLINLMPGGRTLILGYKDLAEFGLYDVPSDSWNLTFRIEPDLAPPSSDPTVAPISML
jgi:WD40 repeat protein